mgnify:CR=1 FL=1
MIASAGVNYGFGRSIAAVRGKRMKRLLLVLAVICDLAVLGVFKYAGFAVTNVNALFGIALPVPAIRLPVGISFFTFQAMSYVIDVYRNRDMCQKDFMKVLLYISFFPQLIAGPIVRWNEIEEQIDHRCLNETEIADGICRFVKGLFKKLIFANGLGKVADHVFALNIGQYGMAVAWLGAVCYALQIFYDFSGYSDMAIGMASMFGFHFQENFKHPYSADSIHEFWRRWHISLGSFFRDYVYIPMGGNRQHQAMNILVVWFLTGMWHGASWNFILWGVYFGIIVMVEKYTVLRIKDRLPRFLLHLYSLVLVVIGWGIFYFDDFGKMQVFFNSFFGGGKVFDDFLTHSALMDNFWLWVAAVLFSMPIRTAVTGWLAGRLRQWDEPLAETLITAGRIAFSVALLVVCAALLVGATNNAFIYTRF